MGKGTSGFYNRTTKGNRLDALLLSSKSKGFSPRKDKRYGSDNRQPQGSRERNVGHPNGEEHSRNAKGNRGPRTKRSTVTQNVGKGVAVIGGSVATGYLLYRSVRLLPSLFPTFWWTIPANLVTP